MQIRVVVECINCDDTGTDVGITDFFTAGVPICSYCAEDMIPVRSELQENDGRLFCIVEDYQNA